MIFLNRSRKRSLEYLEWRVGLFAAGATLAVLGIALRLSWLVYTALAVLIVGAALRFFERPSDEGESEPDSPDPNPGGEGSRAS